MWMMGLGVPEDLCVSRWAAAAHELSGRLLSELGPWPFQMADPLLLLKGELCRASCLFTSTLWQADRSTSNAACFPTFEGGWGLDLWQLENATQKVPNCTKRKIPKYRHLCFPSPEADGDWAQASAGAVSPKQIPPNMKTEPSAHEEERWLLLF